MEDSIEVGSSQTSGGANGLITSANCIGNPTILCLQSGKFSTNCILYQRDSSTGFQTKVWQNIGTPLSPSWNLISSGPGGSFDIGSLPEITTVGDGDFIPVLDEPSGTTSKVMKSNLIKEVVESVATNTTSIGPLASLQTSDKSSIVNALNEVKNAVLPSIVSTIKGIVIPTFKTNLKFDNLGATLNTHQLSIHTSGIGLVSDTAGTVSDGYIKLPKEITFDLYTRTDWLLAWDTTETSASIILGIGDNVNGYLITIANSGGNVVITFPSGATSTNALSGTVNLSVSMVTGNGYITSSVHLLGLPTLASTVPLNVPVYEVASLTKLKLFHAYFNNNAISSKITGFMHNNSGWNGDVSGRLLTQSMAVNMAGYTSELQSIIIIPPRSVITTPMRVVNFFHGRTLQGSSFIDITIDPNTARTLLNAGYAIIASSGGIFNGGAGANGKETDWWGNPRGTLQAGQVYDTLVAQVTNIGNEYLVGWSMGGVGAANYLRTYPNRVKAIYLSCPAMDLEENVNGMSVQQGTLKVSCDAAYCSWYLTLTTNVVDPQTDNGTNYRQVSGPGEIPNDGVRNYTMSTVSAGITGTTIAVTNATRFYPGDIVYFKWSGQMRRILDQATGVPNSIVVDASITVSTNEPISIIRSNGYPGFDYQWLVNRPGVEWTSGNSGINTFQKRKSAHPELDVRPYNPVKFCDFYASFGIPFHIYLGGDGTSTGNDGILNNAPMFAFRDGVNAITPSLVTIFPQVGAGHIGPATLNAADTLALFNAN